MDVPERSAELDSPFIDVRMAQQRDHQVEGARRSVVAMPWSEHAGEPGLLKQYPGRKPRGRHFVLRSLFLSDAPRTLHGPVRKVRGLDHPLEFLGREAAQGEPRFDRPGPFAQSPMGLREPGEEYRLALVAHHGEHRPPHALPVEPLSVRPGRMAFRIRWIEWGPVECVGDVAPQRRQEITPTPAEQRGCGGDPLALHSFEPFESLLGSLWRRRLQRRDQLRRVEPLSVVAVDSHEPIESPACRADVTDRQGVDQRVGRRSLCAVDEEVELVVLADLAKLLAQQRIQPELDRCDQSGAGVLRPAMMHRRLGGQTERAGP